MEELKSNKETAQDLSEKVDQKAELQKIMTEIEALQNDMSSTEEAIMQRSIKQKSEVSVPPPPPLINASNEVGNPRVVNPVASIQSAQLGNQVDVEKEILKDFSAESEEEPWVEETLEKINHKTASNPLDELKQNSPLPDLTSQSASGEFTEKKIAHLSSSENLNHQNVLEMNLKGKVNLVLNYQEVAYCIHLDFKEDSIFFKLFNGLEMKLPLPKVTKPQPK